MFLHSAQWEDFQRRVGRTTRSLGGGAYAVRMELPLKQHYWYTPFAAPEALVEVARGSGAVFAKCEPMQEGGAQDLRSAGFVPAVKQLQPQHSSIVSLGDEEKMLSAMHPKTRYNVRLAARRGVSVSNEGSGEDFWRLMQETTQRDGFSAHPRSYYEELLATEGVSLFEARTQAGVAAEAIVMRHEGRGVYLHGASSYELRASMAPFALHWYIMRTLAREGCSEYDLWGIDEKRWPGVTRFKRGWGGREVSYVGSYDYPTRPFWYTLYRFKNTFL